MSNPTFGYSRLNFGFGWVKILKIHRIKQREKEEEINYFASQRPEQRPNATPTARVSKNLEEIFNKVRYILDWKI